MQVPAAVAEPQVREFLQRVCVDFFLLPAAAECGTYFLKEVFCVCLPCRNSNRAQCAAFILRKQCGGAGSRSFYREHKLPVPQDILPVRYAECCKKMCGIRFHQHQGNVGMLPCKDRRGKAQSKPQEQPCGMLFCRKHGDLLHGFPAGVVF